MRKAVDAGLQATTLRGAHVGVLAVDAGDATPLYARNADDAFVPASTFKLLAGSVALDRLGPAFTFVTELDAVPNGLALVGGGDAQLSTGDLEAAAAAVAASGALQFDTLLGDATRYHAPRYPGGWSIDDLPYDYAAVPSALSLEENAVHAALAPGDAAGSSTTLVTAPASNAFAFENLAITGAHGSEDTTDVERPWERPTTIRLVGSVPLGVKQTDDLHPAVPDPPAYALDVLRLALFAHGVAIGGVTQGRVPANATRLWRHESMPLAKLLAAFWQPSDNLLGEQLLLELGAASGDTRAGGIAVEREWLRGIGVDPATLTIADGSGLSEYDRVTPSALVRILEADWHGTERSIVLDALPQAGNRGTLKTTFTQAPLAGNVFAKTGSINHARTLAGYLMTKRHGTVAFALLINDWMDDSGDATAALDRVRAAVLEALAR